jgi:hypothetical protein
MFLDTTHFSRNDTKTSLREKRRKAVKTWRYRVPIFEREKGGREDTHSLGVHLWKKEKWREDRIKKEVWEKKELIYAVLRGLCASYAIHASLVFF